MSTAVTNQQMGSSLIEVMFCVLLVGIVALAVAQSSVLANRKTTANRYASIATQLAFEQLEAFAATDPETITADSTTTESNLLRDGISFSRVTSFTVNSDRTRSISVSVTSNHLTNAQPVTLSSRYALWGRR